MFKVTHRCKKLYTKCQNEASSCSLLHAFTFKGFPSYLPHWPTQSEQQLHRPAQFPLPPPTQVTGWCCKDHTDTRFTQYFKTKHLLTSVSSAKKLAAASEPLTCPQLLCLMNGSSLGSEMAQHTGTEGRNWLKKGGIGAGFFAVIKRRMHTRYRRPTCPMAEKLCLSSTACGGAIGLIPYITWSYMESSAVLRVCVAVKGAQLTLARC